MDVYLAFTDCGSSIVSRKEFPNEYNIFTYKTRQGSSCLHSLPSKGHLRLEFKFAKALPDSVTVICYGKFPVFLKIDHSWNVNIE